LVVTQVKTARDASQDRRDAAESAHLAQQEAALRGQAETVLNAVGTPSGATGAEACGVRLTATRCWTYTSLPLPALEQATKGLTGQVFDRACSWNPIPAPDGALRLKPWMENPDWTPCTAFVQRDDFKLIVDAFPNLEFRGGGRMPTFRGTSLSVSVVPPPIG
jgi:hypothetical protein